MRSEMGKGTTFRVSLPIAGRRSSQIPPAPQPTHSTVRRGNILVIDDEQLILSAVQRILSNDHDIVGTLVAREALALCSSGQHFDLILCDLMMPEMTGMDLYIELTRLAPDQAANMVFLSGGAFTPKARDFLAVTPVEHIEKPFEARNLRAFVQRHLRAQSASNSLTHAS